MISNKQSSIFTYLAILFFTFQIDRVTKQLALLYAAHRYEINKFLAFDLVFNRGITAGMLHTDSPLLFTLLTAFICLIIAVLTYYTWHRFMANKNIIGELLVLSGAVSNVIDRIVYGGVIDFIHFSWGSLSFPIFNIADVLIVGGIAIMFLVHWNE
jgi:signal peptidase II